MLATFFKELLKAPIAAKIGVAVITLHVLFAVFAPVIAPYSETEIVGQAWEEASETTILGTDQIGRDMWTRLLYGARNTISIAFITTVLTFGMGMAGGFLAATLGGWVDMAFSRAVDILMAIPTLIFALMLLSVLGTSIPVLIMVIAFLDSTRVYRLARAVARDVVVMDFLEVARLRGEGAFYIMRHEILPNTLAPLVAEFGVRFCFVFLFISSLSFLGLGIQPPLADWGSMVRENSALITYGILTPLLPAAAIATLTIGVNMVVDWFLHKTARIRDEV